MKCSHGPGNFVNEIMFQFQDIISVLKIWVGSGHVPNRYRVRGPCGLITTRKRRGIYYLLRMDGLGLSPLAAAFWSGGGSQHALQVLQALTTHIRSKYYKRRSRGLGRLASTRPHYYVACNSKRSSTTLDSRPIECNNWGGQFKKFYFAWNLKAYNTK